MPISKAAGWLTSDGQFFEKPEDCKDAEFKRLITEYIYSVERSILSIPGKSFNTEDLLGSVLADRMVLLSIFKELNGGPVLTAPSKITDGESPLP